MTHYEERLEQDLATIRARVEAIASDVEQALKSAVHAVLMGDQELASATILGDLPINRQVRALDRICHGFVARHLPSAGHLRFVSSVLRLNVELERIGDYAVAIAREAVQLSIQPTGPVARDIELVSDQARRVLSQAMRSFIEGNAELARGTKAMASQIDSTFQKVFPDLLQEGERGARSIKDLFALLTIVNRLGRVADQAKNICEDTLFAVAGETKAEKVYRILFVDERNDCLSQIAEAYARKVFPESGRYSSAGWNPSPRLDASTEVFLDRHALDARGLHPKSLALPVDELADFHVIVSLQGNARPQIPELPFHTTLLTWDVGEIPTGLDPERTEALIEEALKRLTPRIRELMETLRGDQAS